MLILVSQVMVSRHTSIRIVVVPVVVHHRQLQRNATASSNDMDLSAINQDDSIRPPTFHEEESSSSSSGQSEMMREFNRMKNELKKFQTEAAISALGSSSSSVIVSCTSIKGRIRTLLEESSLFKM